jgi:hypothetical protein
MKQTCFAGLIVAAFFTMVSTVMAIDVPALDKVSVLMPKQKVLSILGAPDDKGTLGMDLTTEIYKMESTSDSMLGAGLIYGKDQVLKGQAFMLDGMVAKQSAERMKAIGFTLDEAKEHFYLLRGKDDDTGIPIAVYIIEQNGMTTIMTFEKEFYDRMTKH